MKDIIIKIGKIGLPVIAVIGAEYNLFIKDYNIVLTYILIGILFIIGSDKQ